MKSNKLMANILAYIGSMAFGAIFMAMLIYGFIA